jgi:uroporphyrinogen-III synthase
MARVLLLRAEDDARASAARLAALGHQAVIAPLARAEATGRRIATPQATGLIGTSRRAFSLLHADDRALLEPLPVLAVGPATAAAARAAGFRDVTAAGGDARDLARLIIATRPACERLLYLAGELRGSLLEDTLAASGFVLTVVDVYRIVPATQLPETAIAALRAGHIEHILHYSPASAARFAMLALQAGLAREAAKSHQLCLSQAVAEALSPLAPGAVAIAAEPSQDALLALLPG